MKCGKDDLILGLPWLNRINPIIDWENKHVEINDATDMTEDYNRAIYQNQPNIRTFEEEPTHPNLLPDEYLKETPLYPDEYFRNYLDGTEYIHMKKGSTTKYVKRQGKLVDVAKVSLSGRLAQQAKEKKIELPEEYLEFAEVFSEEASQRIPQEGHTTTPSISTTPSYPR